MMWNWGYGGNSFAGGWLVMALFGALIVAGVVLLVVWLVRGASGHGQAAGLAPQSPAANAGHDEALAIAKRRFASGEIGKDEYDAIVQALKG